MIKEDLFQSGLGKSYDERAKIGFSDDVSTWKESTAVFDEHTLRIEGHPVMEDWETGYMRSLAEVASGRGGVVLEVGFGMGISANFVQEFPIAEHIIIEANHDVYQRLVDFAATASRRVTPMRGFWQEVVAQLPDKSVDGILFDTYPLTQDEVHGNHFPFFSEAFRILKDDGVFTYYSDEPEVLSAFHQSKLREAGFSQINAEVCAVEPPADCQYWKHKTIVVPIVSK